MSTYLGIENVLYFQYQNVGFWIFDIVCAILFVLDLVRGMQGSANDYEFCKLPFG